MVSIKWKRKVYVLLCLLFTTTDVQSLEELKPHPKVSASRYSWDDGEQHANRVCPEFGGVFSRSQYPDGPDAACVVEGDILCPHFTPSLCEFQGKKLVNCKAAEGDRTPRRSYKANPFITQDLLTYDYKYSINVRIGENFTKEAVDHIAQVHQWLEKFLCLKHFVFRMKPSSKTTSDYVMTTQAYIKWERSACLCAIDGIGAPSMRDSLHKDEIPHRTIYMPDFMIKDEDMPSLTDLYGGVQTVRKPVTRKIPYGDESKGSNPIVSCGINPYNKIHLILHALGIGHETNRPDRVKWVHVNKRQIMRPTDNKIEPERFFRTDNFELPYYHAYDKTRFISKSVTAYDPYDWSFLRDIPVLSPTTYTYHPQELGHRGALDSLEIERLQAIFGKATEDGTCSVRGLPVMGRSRRRCQHAAETESTERSGDSRHFGARVRYNCKKISNALLGTEERVCQRSGQWSGYTPVCVEKDAVNLYCTANSRSGKCKFLQERTHNHIEEPMNPNQERFRRSIPHDHPKAQELFFTEHFTTSIFRPKTNQSCVHLYYTFGASVPVEVSLLDESNAKVVIWKDLTTDHVLQEHMILFNTGLVKPGQPYRLEIRGTDMGSRVSLPLELNYIAIVDGKCFKV